MLTYRYGSALVTNVPSAPIFALRADDFSLNLRARMQLPALLAPFHSVPVHHMLSQTGIATQVHDAVRDSILTSAALADHAVKQEPVGIYGLGQRTGVDGIIERDPPIGPVLPGQQGLSFRPHVAGQRLMYSQPATHHLRGSVLGQLRRTDGMAMLSGTAATSSSRRLSHPAVHHSNLL